LESLGIIDNIFGNNKKISIPKSYFIRRCNIILSWEHLSMDWVLLMEPYFHNNFSVNNIGMTSFVLRVYTKFKFNEASEASLNLTVGRLINY